MNGAIVQRMVLPTSSRVGVGAMWQRFATRCLLVAFCITAAIAPAVPEGIGAVEAALMATVLLFMGWTLLTIPWIGRDHQVARTDLAIHAFLGYLFCSFVVIAGTYDLTVSDWGRGIIPFVGLTLYFAGKRLVSAYDAQSLLLGMLALCLFNLWFGLGNVAVADIPDAQSILYARATLDAKMFDPACVAVPIALLVASLMCANRLMLGYLASGAVLSTASLASVMRSNIVIFGAVLGFVLLLQWRFIVPRVLRMLPIFLLLAVVGLVLYLSWGSSREVVILELPSRLIEAIWHRFDYGGEAYRLYEHQVVFGEWLNAPLLGHGFGASFEISRGSALGVISMRYTHNLYTYMLFAGGAVGVLFLSFLMAGILACVVRTLRECGKGTLTEVEAALAATLVGYVLYAQFQSQFRSLCFFMIVGLLLGALTGRLQAVSRSHRMVSGRARR